MKQPTFVFGAGGHAKVIINAMIESGMPPSCALIDSGHVDAIFGIPVFALSDFHFPKRFRFVVAIGDAVTRREKFDFLRSLGGEAVSVIHPTASVSKFSTVGVGSVLFARTVIDPEVSIGENCIINAGAMIGHESKVENDSHISGGALIGGCCHVGARVFVGIGAIVASRVSIGDDAFIAMGALVSKDIPSHSKAISPSRRECFVSRLDHGSVAIV